MADGLLKGFGSVPTGKIICYSGTGDNGSIDASGGIKVTTPHVAVKFSGVEFPDNETDFAIADTAGVHFVNYSFLNGMIADGEVVTMQVAYLKIDASSDMKVAIMTAG